MTSFRKEVIGNATLYLGDCMEIMQTLLICDACFGEKYVTPMGIEDCGKCGGSGKNHIDAIITDPPFGVGNFVQSNRGAPVSWNDQPPPMAVFDLMRKISGHRI